MTNKNNVQVLGGGVNVNHGGNFIMNGGTINNNTARSNVGGRGRGGGGVAVLTERNVSRGSSGFYMTGGTISNNTARNGGGILTVLYSDTSTVAASRYANIRIYPAARFSGNQARVMPSGGSRASAPPDNRLATVLSTTVSIHHCILNNHDVKYTGRIGGTPAAIHRALRDLQNPDLSWNWTAVDTLIRRPYAQITNAQFEALAAVYMGIPVGNTATLQRFINGLGHTFSAGDSWIIFDPNNVAGATLATGTLWQICERKATAIQRHVENNIALLLAYEMNRAENMTVRQVRHTLQQRSMLLQTAGNLTTKCVVHFPEHGTRPFQLGFIILGTSSSPNININWSGSEYNMFVNRAEARINWTTMSTWQNVPDRAGYRIFLSMLSLDWFTITNVLTSYHAGNRIIRSGGTREIQNHRFNVVNHLVGASGSIALGFVSGIPGHVIGAATALNPLPAMAQARAAQNSIRGMLAIALEGHRISAHWLDVVNVYATRMFPGGFSQQVGSNTLSFHIWASPHTAITLGFN